MPRNGDRGVRTLQSGGDLNPQTALETRPEAGKNTAKKHLDSFMDRRKLRG